MEDAPAYGAWQQACAQWETVQKLLRPLEGLRQSEVRRYGGAGRHLTEEQLHATAGDNPHCFCTITPCTRWVKPCAYR